MGRLPTLQLATRRLRVGLASRPSVRPIIESHEPRYASDALWPRLAGPSRSLLSAASRRVSDEQGNPGYRLAKLHWQKGHRRPRRNTRKRTTLFNRGRFCAAHVSGISQRSVLALAGQRYRATYSARRRCLVGRPSQFVGPARRSHCSVGPGPAGRRRFPGAHLPTVVASSEVDGRPWGDSVLANRAHRQRTCPCLCAARGPSSWHQSPAPPSARRG